MTAKPLKRRWYQFRLRTLFIAILVLSLPLSWFAVRMEKARRQRVAVEEIERLGGDVRYEFLEDLTTPKWQRRFLGQDFFGKVNSVFIVSSGFDDDKATCLTGLPDLELLTLDLTQISDHGLRYIEELTSLRILSLSDLEITDAGLEHLEGLIRLKDLDLSRTPITDAGLVHLRGLENLRTLVLNRTQVSDAGLEYLEGMIGLKKLCLDGTQVTPEGVERLQEALPNCEIMY